MRGIKAALIVVALVCAGAGYAGEGSIIFADGSRGFVAPEQAMFWPELSSDKIVFVGEPGQVERRLQEPPESVSVQSPGPLVREYHHYHEAPPREERGGVLAWIGQGVQATLGFLGEWVVERPLNVAREGVVATRHVGRDAIDGAGNMARVATE